MSRLFNAWGALSPNIRFAIRTVAIAAVTFAVNAYSDNSFTWDGLIDTVKVAAGYAILGLLTPLEPFVGVGRPEEVTLPEDTAVIEEEK